MDLLKYKGDYKIINNLFLNEIKDCENDRLSFFVDKLGADINYIDDMGNSLLSYAIEANNETGFSFLLDKGVAFEKDKKLLKNESYKIKIEDYFNQKKDNFRFDIDCYLQMKVFQEKLRSSINIKNCDDFLKKESCKFNKQELDNFNDFEFDSLMRDDDNF